MAWASPLPSSARFALTTTQLVAVLVSPHAAQGRQPAAATPAASQPAAPSKQPTTSWRFIPGQGLSVTSRGGDFELTTRVRAQLRYTLVDDHSDTGELEQSLQLRRARLQFTGHLFGQHNRYKIQLAFSPRDLGLKDGRLTRTPLFDWYMTFDYLRDLTLRVGQYRVPYSRERVISSGRLQMVDRSIVNAEFNLDRDIGLDLRSKNLFGWDLVRYYAFVGLGEGRDGFQLDDFGMMYIARIEVLPFGMFGDYSEVDFARDRLRLSLGASYGFVDNAKRDRGIIGSIPLDGGTTDTHNLDVDALLKWRGLTAQAAFMLRMASARTAGDEVDAQGNPVQTAPPRDGYGAFVQVGYLFSVAPLAPAARYGLVRPIGDSTDSSLARRDELGGSLSYFFAGHPFKLQLDYFRVWGADGVEDGVDRVRLQLQGAL